MYCSWGREVLEFPNFNIKQKIFRKIEDGSPLTLAEIVDDMFKLVQEEKSTYKHSLYSVSLKVGDDYFLNLNYRRLAELNREELYNQAEGLAQSGRDLDLIEKITVDITTLDPPYGDTPPPSYIKTSRTLLENLSRRETGRPTLYLQSRDAHEKGCCFLAISQQQLIHEKPKGSRLHVNQIVRRAKQIAEQCGLPYDEPVGPREIAIIDRKLKYRLCVFAFNNDALRCIYRSEKENKTELPIFLALVDRTYYLLHRINDVSLRSQFPKSVRFCNLCLQIVNNIARHLTCQAVCPYCLSPAYLCPDDRGASPVSCRCCHREMKNGYQCFRNHLVPIKKEILGIKGGKQRARSTCNTYKKCITCQASYNTMDFKEHKCDEVLF